MNNMREWAGFPAASALLILGLATLTGVASADPPDFTEHSIARDLVQQVSIVDLDNDGDPDVIATAPGRIYWYENDGASTPGFTRRTIRTQSSGHIYAADIDGDGDIDVASATGDILPCNSTNSQLAWSENHGGRRQRQ